ncbi:MAG: peptidylprolyl isomerase [Sedimentisphaerales bacterium]|nr:peptidylprolyl isomerase [Sedimentisphaerales bacterium]
MRTCSLGKGILLCLTIVVIGTNLNCREKSPEEKEVRQTEPNTPSEPDVNAPSETIPKDVAVIVNGVEIKNSAVLDLIGPHLAKINQQSTGIPSPVAEQYKKQLREQALEQLIRRQLLDEKIKDANITITDEEVVNKIEALASDQNMSLEDFKKALEQNNQNFDEVKEDFRKQLSRNKFMDAQWAGKTDVTEEETKKYYDENKKRFDVPEHVRVSHILIKYKQESADADPNAAKARVKAKAQDLLQQIKDGADFAELAKAHSDCLSASKGGDLGFFPRGYSTPKFDKVAFELEVGQVSDVVETEYGCHIIKATGHKDATVIPFEEAKDKIITELEEEKQKEFAEKYINSLKAEAKIVFPKP